MTYPIQECSPKARLKVLSDVGSGERGPNDKQKYPTDGLLVGQCFCVPIAEVNQASLRVTISRQAKDTGKKFAVLTHLQFNCYEVVRLV